MQSQTKCLCWACVAKASRGDVIKTRPGSFPCKAILHVCGERDADVIEQLVCRIIQLCESCEHTSVAIPAICAGKYNTRSSKERTKRSKMSIWQKPHHSYFVNLNDHSGAGGLDPALVAQTILRGVSTTASSGRLRSLTSIRLVLIKISVFLAFKQRAMQMFPSADISTG